MKERPILFSAPMVRAILEGRKTQTRRFVKPRKDRLFGCVLQPNELAGEINNGSFCNSFYGKPGDRLWVRETWQHSNYPFGPLDHDCEIFYRADYWDDPHGMDGEKSPEGKYRDWKPSIHLPRWASRINLEITGVRIEPLQDISETDAKAEGVNEWFENGPFTGMESKTFLTGYRKIWELINGQGSWGKNPWVWVIEFKVCERGG